MGGGERRVASKHVRVLEGCISYPFLLRSNMRRLDFAHSSNLLLRFHFVLDGVARRR